ncbi:MAG: PLP-dependent transferase [Pseudomonadota bacterium]
MRSDPRSDLPLGHPIPDSPHAVSVSLPRWQDVIDYEEGRPRVLDQLRSGYPRFRLHPAVRGINAAAGGFLFASPRAAEACVDSLRAAGETGRLLAWRGLAGVAVEATGRKRALEFWQHSGEIVSSRRAEALLRGGESPARDARDPLRARVAALCASGPEDVFLFPTGMSSIYNVHAVLVAMGAADGRTVQFGFPYLDTLKVQERLGPGAIFFAAGDEDDLARLAALLEGERPAAVFTEMPANPLLRSVDLPRLFAMTRRAGVPLVVDDSIGAFVNQDLLSRADVLVASLTKYFTGRGDVMGGAAILNPASPFYEALASGLAARRPFGLFDDDARLLEEGSRDLTARMARINENGERLADALAVHPAVARVYYPKYETRGRYEACLRPGGGYGGLLSLLLVDGAETMPAFHDALPIRKGPSFGLGDTIACPYTLLAHYTELDWAERAGISRHLLRVSVGLEDSGQLLDVFERALRTLR